MFNWTLLCLLIAICIPGILSLMPTTQTIYASLKQTLPAKKKLPSKNIFIILSIIQTFILIIIASAFGTAVNHNLHLHAPFLEALSHHQSGWLALQSQLLPSCIAGIGGAAIFLSAYYFIARPRLDAQTVKCMESLRLSAGICARIFYGGIVEEVLCRWGLMAFFVWLGALLFGEPSPAIMWAAILISGLLFGIGHLPSYLAFGCKKTPAFITTAITLNLWASIIFGWLFWHDGLGSAIIAHMLFHITWYPIDLFIARTNATKNT